ncbi:MAG: ATP-binding protein [Reichenbachiella sp.]
MRITNLLFVFALAGFSCQPKTEKTSLPNESTIETTATVVSLNKLWKSDTLLTTSEGIVYHSGLDVLFVSCINEIPPTTHDNDGFIAKVSPSTGEIIELKWIDGLSAPKGMAIVGNSLFVTNIDEIVEIDIETARIINKLPIEGTSFLNDITAAEDGRLYISGSNSNKIFEYNQGVITVFKEDEAFKNPNGVFLKNGYLFVASMGGDDFMKINLESKEMTVLTDSIAGGDGIVSIGKDFIVSTWPGQVFHVQDDGTKTLLMDTRNQKVNAADICYITETQTLYVPTFFGNSIAAYKVSQ